MNISALDFIILSLATWRLSSLFADEDGPFDVFERVRNWLGVRYVSDGNGGTERYVPDDIPVIRHTVARGIICRWCNSVWFGILLAVLYAVSYNTSWSAIATICFLSLSISTVTILVDNTMSDTERIV